jgi:hypothetical protein
LAWLLFLIGGNNRNRDFVVVKDKDFCVWIYLFKFKHGLYGDGVVRGKYFDIGLIEFDKVPGVIFRIGSKERILYFDDHGNIEKIKGYFLGIF